MTQQTGFHRVCILGLVACVFSSASHRASAATIVSYAGGSYTQNFNSLPATTPDPIGTYDVPNTAGPILLGGTTGLGGTAMNGWYFARASGTNTSTLFRVAPGDSPVGATYSFGANGDSNRGLGTIAAGGQTPTFGLILENSTSQTLTEFSVAFTGQQWRRGSGGANALRFRYLVGGTSILQAENLFTEVPSLAFIAPVTAGTSIELDGYLPQNQVPLSATITDLSWLPGQTLVLRWTDVDNSGFDDGLAIDNFSFVAVPEPTSVALVAAGLGIGLVMRAYRRRGGSAAGRGSHRSPLDV
jgi:hypothetical protein